MLTPEDAKNFVRRHFDDFVNRQDLSATGIVIWRIAEGKLAERWAYLQAPHPIH